MAFVRVDVFLLLGAGDFLCVRVRVCVYVCVCVCMGGILIMSVVGKFVDYQQ